MSAGQVTTVDRALGVWQAFGPERGRPVEQRWAESVPELAPEEYAATSARCERIESVAYDLALDVYGGTLCFAAACERLASAFPDLSAERLSRTLNQAMYFSK